MANSGLRSSNVTLKAAITKDEDANIRLNDFMDQCIEFPSNTPDVV